jgi:hypothetical protein
MTLVKIKRVEGRTSFGVKDEESQMFKPKYDDCFDKWSPGLNRHTGVLRTGLTFEESSELEKKLGLEEGDLSPAGRYWSNFVVIIPHDGLTINADKAANPIGYIQVKALSDDPKIASSEDSAATQASAEFVLTNEIAEAKSKNAKFEVKGQAYAKFYSMTNSEIVDALYMFGMDPGDIDIEVAKARLSTKLDTEAGMKEFMNVVGDPSFKDKVWLAKLIKLGILRKQGTGIGFDMPIYFGDVILGKGLESSIAYIKDKENQNIYIGLKKAHEALLKKK